MDDLSIREIVDSVGRGQIRIPAFQRGFVWEPERVAYLMDRRDEAGRDSDRAVAHWCRRFARSRMETHFEPPRGKEPRRRKSPPASLPGARCGIPPGSAASRSALPHPGSPSSVSEEKILEMPCGKGSVSAQGRAPPLPTPHLRRGSLPKLNLARLALLRARNARYGVLDLEPPFRFRNLEDLR